MNFIDTLSESLFGGMSGGGQSGLISLLGGILPGQAASGNVMGGLGGLLPGLAKENGLSAAGGLAAPGLMNLLGGDAPKAPQTLLAGLGEGLGKSGAVPQAPSLSPSPQPQPQPQAPPVLANALGDILRNSGAMPGAPKEQLPWSPQPAMAPPPAAPAGAPGGFKVTGDDVSSFIRSVMAGTAGVNPRAPGISAFAQGASGAISSKDQHQAAQDAQKLAAEDRAMKLEDRDLANDDKAFDRTLKTSQEKRAGAKAKIDARTAEINNTLALTKAMRGLDGNLTTDQKFKLNDQLYRYADKINKNAMMKPEKVDSALAVERDRLLKEYGVQSPAAGAVSGAPPAGPAAGPKPAAPSNGDGKSYASPKVFSGSREQILEQAGALGKGEYYWNPADGQIYKKQ